MEIPVINFEASINSLNNPSLISRFFSIFELGKLSHSHRLWKWGALFLALVYAFTSIINKIKILILYYHNKSKSILASEPLLSYLDDEFSSDDDENEDVCSTPDSLSSSDDDEEDKDEDEEEEEREFRRNYSFDEDFNVKGSFRNFSENWRQKRKFKLLRRKKSVVDNFSLSDLVSGKSVVKLWDGLSLGVVEINNAFSFLDCNHDSENMFSRNSVFDAISASPNVYISSDEKSGLNIWDLRTGFKSPAVHSDRSGKMIGVDSGKVYVRNDVTMGLAVSDVRKIETPLTDDVWCDEDGVSGFEKLD